MASLDNGTKTKASDFKSTQYTASVEFGKDYTRICVRNIEDLPAVVNDIVDAKRRMLADEFELAKTPANAEESGTVIRERQGIENTDSTQLDDDEDETQTSPCTKRRKMNPVQDTLVSDQNDPHLLLESNDSWHSLGWKTFDCGMWDQTKGKFPGASFLKDSRLGEQCPRSGVFHLLPETYSMGEGWAYKYAKCGCASNETSYSAVVRLVLPARQDGSDLKCYLIQVATEDLEQDHCQHQGDDGGAHVLPGGEFAMEPLRKWNNQ